MKDPVMDGRRIKTLLADPVVQEVFADMQQVAFAEFRAATTDDARREAWARANAVDRFIAGLQAVVDEGVMREERERQSETRKGISE